MRLPQPSGNLFGSSYKVIRYLTRKGYGESKKKNGWQGAASQSAAIFA